MGLISSAASVQEARAIVREALEDALGSMGGMVGNAGQEVVFEEYVEPAFRENTGDIKDGWDDVDIGEYMDFMGEIVDEGNGIMADAYAEAEAILTELEEQAESMGEDFDFDE